MKKFIYSLLMLLGVLVYATGCQKDEDKQEPIKVEVTGTVVNKATGKAISKAKVSLGDESATTNDKGVFEFSGVKPGKYNLKITATGYTTYDESVTVPEKKSYEIDKITLTKSSGTPNGSDDEEDKDGEYDGDYDDEDWKDGEYDGEYDDEDWKDGEYDGEYDDEGDKDGEYDNEDWKDEEKD